MRQFHRAELMCCVAVTSLLAGLWTPVAEANITVLPPVAANHTASLNLVPNGSVTLNPDPVNYLAGAPKAMQNELAAEFPAWTFNYMPGLAGTLQVNRYQATTKGGLNGGGLLDATYTREATDPAIADLFWIQMVDTNSPLGGNTSPYIDPRPNDDTLPFYWTLAEDAQAANGNKTANTYHFYDNSNRTGTPGSNINWTGDLMLASWDHNDPGVVYVYDGVQWGWNLTVPAAVPEPETWALVLLGGLGLAASRARRRA